MAEFCGTTTENLSAICTGAFPFPLNVGQDYSEDTRIVSNTENLKERGLQTSCWENKLTEMS